jgi:hypothetical protein
MATIIDQLIVELGLDPTKFVEGGHVTVAEYKKLVEGIDKHSKDAVKSVKTVEDGFTKVTRAIGEMTAGYLTVTGISSFIQQTNATNVAVGQLATTLGLMPDKIAQYTEAARRANINPQSMTSALNTLNMRAGAAKQGQDSALFDPLARLGVNPNVVWSNDPTTMLRGIASAAQKQIAGGRPLDEVNANLAAIGLNGDLIYMIDRSDKKLKEFFEDAEKLHATTNAQIESSTRLLSAWNEFVPILTKLGNSIAKDLDGPLGWLVKTMGGVNDHMEAFKHLLEEIGGLLIGTSLGAAIGGIIGFFSPVPGGMAIGAGIGARIGAGVGLLGGAGLAVSSPPDPNLAAAPKGGSNAVAPAGGGAIPSTGNGSVVDRSKLPGINDPAFAEALGGMIKSEVGLGPGHEDAAIMQGETALNRAMVKKQSILSTLYGGYYPGIGTMNEKERQWFYTNVWPKLKTSNLSEGATGNSSNEPGNMVAMHDIQRKRMAGYWYPVNKNHDPYNVLGGGHVPDDYMGGKYEWFAYEHAPKNNLAPVAPAQAAPATGSNAVVPAAPAEEGWGHWLGRHMPSFLSPSSSSTTNNKQSSLSIGNMNFHGVRDMKDVADNIQPFIANRFSAVAADTGYG